MVFRSTSEPMTPKIWTNALGVRLWVIALYTYDVYHVPFVKSRSHKDTCIATACSILLPKEKIAPTNDQRNDQGCVHSNGYGCLPERIDLTSVRGGIQYDKFIPCTS